MRKKIVSRIRTTRGYAGIVCKLHYGNMESMCLALFKTTNLVFECYFRHGVRRSAWFGCLGVVNALESYGM